MMQTKGFGGHHVLYGPQHGGFSWIGLVVFLIVGIVIVIFIMKWLKKKSKSTSMELFIQTTLATSP
ncbi:hypothetical protein [Ureibacillus sp. GCM10028918]|uniref:hypothetical protein n=1 Tax=Ureibacillus sp. GCM10028918 TaxID=3273429 RepID=UPI003609858D